MMYLACCIFVSVLSITIISIFVSASDCEQCWVPSNQPDIDCVSHFLCTKSNYTYRETIDTKFDFFHESACQGLLKKNITEIVFLGDSFMRHIYQGFIVNLSGNYYNGSIPSSRSDCLYERQIGDRHKCSYLWEATVCNGAVALRLNQKFHVLEFGKVLRNEYISKPGTVVFFSIGNHPIVRNANRLGVNNATVTIPVLYKNYCSPTLPEFNFNGLPKSNSIKNFYWVSTHARLVHYFRDETESLILNYNLNMREYVERECPRMGYIDVYNLTESLIKTHYNESLSMTDDKVHWGFTVNLLKTSVILNQILK